MKQIDNGIQEHLKNIFYKYLHEPLSEKIFIRVKEEIQLFLYSLIEDDYYNDSISIDVYQEKSGTLTFHPDNLFTLIYMHTGKIPPVMFMPNKGNGKDEFEWNEFRYSFIYDYNLDLYIPNIKEL